MQREFFFFFGELQREIVWSQLGCLDISLNSPYSLKKDVSLD